MRVPAGTFDCWVVAVHADAGRGLYWVTKPDPIVVRSALDVPAMGGAQLVSALSARCARYVVRHHHGLAVHRAQRKDSAQDGSVMVPPRPPVPWAHVSGQAGVWRAWRADRGAVAQAARMAGGSTPIPSRPSRHRSGCGARRDRRVRRGQGAARASSLGIPSKRLTGASREQLARSASVWIDRHGRPAESYRFDVVGVLVEGDRVRVRHVPNAFSLPHSA